MVLQTIIHSIVGFLNYFLKKNTSGLKHFKTNAYCGLFLKLIPCIISCEYNHQIYPPLPCRLESCLLRHGLPPPSHPGNDYMACPHLAVGTLFKGRFQLASSGPRIALPTPSWGCGNACLPYPQSIGGKSTCLPQVVREIWYPILFLLLSPGDLSYRTSAGSPILAVVPRGWNLMTRATVTILGSECPPL